MRQAGLLRGGFRCELKPPTAGKGLWCVGAGGKIGLCRGMFLPGRMGDEFATVQMTYFIFPKGMIFF